MSKISTANKSYLWIAAILIVGIIATVTYISTASRRNTIEQSVANAKNTVQQYTDLRAYYTQNVIAKIKKYSNMRISFDHMENDSTIPIPATFLHDVSERFATSHEGFSLKLYSDFPFPNRKDRVLDDFANSANKYFRSSTTDTTALFVKTEKMDGKEVVRVAVADRMRLQTCVDCHNTHPLSPKKDWKLGDIRGVLELDTPIDEQLKKADMLAANIRNIGLGGVLILFVLIFFILRHERARVKSEKLAGAYQTLETDNIRKTTELSEARELQLAMLPKKFPLIKGLEIATYLQSATEVGGDYYDYTMGKDGTLNLAVGDATGHGMKAGVMVATVKSYFQSLANESETTELLRNVSKKIETMNLSGLNMCLALLKYKDGKMKINLAGMPPVLIYRKAQNRVESVELAGMPLGSFTDFPYQEASRDLLAGDTILVMSDGLPELRNPYDEVLDYYRVENFFAEIAQQPVNEIANELSNFAMEWSAGRALEDDITFVVMKQN